LGLDKQDFLMYYDIGNSPKVNRKGVCGMFKISLAAARVNAGYSQKEAAKLLGVSNKTLCGWENGTSFPNSLQIEKICNFYGLPYDCINFLPNNSLKANEENCSKNV
jgi:transcriptional regulator with XRE-family HTH domain